MKKMNRIATMAVALAAGTLAAAEISSTTLTAVFLDAKKGRLAHLTARDGKDFVSQRNEDSPLWEVTACKTDAFATKTVVRAY